MKGNNLEGDQRQNRQKILSEYRAKQANVETANEHIIIKSSFGYIYIYIQTYIYIYVNIYIYIYITTVLSVDYDICCFLT